HGLIKFNIRTLSYMNFINSNNAVKEISKFIFDIYLADFKNIATLSEDNTNENLLHQLIIQCLPELNPVDSKSKGNGYFNLFPEITKQLIEDFNDLSSIHSFLLKHIEDFFKSYYFQYLNQVLLQVKDSGTGTAKVNPIFYTMDLETLCETRLSRHSIGWKQ